MAIYGRQQFGGEQPCGKQQGQRAHIGVCLNPVAVTDVRIGPAIAVRSQPQQSVVQRLRCLPDRYDLPQCPLVA